MTEVESRLKDKSPCPCGVDTCTQYGLILKKSGHVRGCACAKCRAGRNSRQGKARHRKVARQIGASSGGGFASSTEEHWRDWARWEVKSGAQVDPVITRFEKARAQSELDRALGDSRPFVFAAVPSSSRRPSVVCISLEDWVTHVVPLVNEYGGFA